MIELVDVDESLDLDDYAEIAHLTSAVYELRSEAKTLVPHLKNRRVWMVNSTAEGGGVAEMLPKVVDMMREVGVDTRWAVIKTEEEDFFPLTKQLHNLIHGTGDPEITRAQKELYERVSDQLASELAEHVEPDDLLVIHDPQPLGTGAKVIERTGAQAIWRSHIGVDESNRQTDAAWDFLKPYTEGYVHSVFSAPEYIPPFLAGDSSVIHPAIDPLSHKNRDLHPHKLVGIICNAGLHVDCHPVLTPAWNNQAKILQGDGKFAPLGNREIGLLYRPMVTQISRWDRLKGWLPLLKGFLKMKERDFHATDGRTLRRRKLVRLVMAGPDPEAIQDDPESQEVIKELSQTYRDLSSQEQEAVAILSLPMTSRKENALMVNALQRCATIIVQNSLREGFGLTASEGMWKGNPLLGTCAVGLREQIRDGIDGRLNETPEDPTAIADLLTEMLDDADSRERWGKAARRHVHERFLVFVQVSNWLRRLAQVAGS